MIIFRHENSQLCQKLETAAFVRGIGNAAMQFAPKSLKTNRTQFPQNCFLSKNGIFPRFVRLMDDHINSLIGSQNQPHSANENGLVRPQITKVSITRWFLGRFQKIKRSFAAKLRLLSRAAKNTKSRTVKMVLQFGPWPLFSKIKEQNGPKKTLKINPH